MMSAGRSADCYIQSDARAGVEALESLLAKRSVNMTGYRTPEVKKSLVDHFQDRAEFPIDPGTVDPREACLALDEIVPTDIPLATGSGASSGFTNVLFNRSRPFVLACKFFGCIGQTLPAAMGAMVANGIEKPMLLVDGDAGTMMHLADFDTAVRYNMPLLVVVLNDQALGSEYQNMVAHKMKAELSIIPTPDLVAVATGLGGRGRLASSVEEVRAAAAEWVAKPGPMIIDVRISRTVVNLSYRRRYYARDE